jgi:hypothetical protein
MIEQYLPNNNETATVAFRQKFCQLNSPFVMPTGSGLSCSASGLWPSCNGDRPDHTAPTTPGALGSSAIQEEQDTSARAHARTHCLFERGWGEPSPGSFRWISRISSHPAVFFSHNKPANSTFSHNNPAKRIGCLLALSA